MTGIDHEGRQMTQMSSHAPLIVQPGANPSIPPERKQVVELGGVASRRWFLQIAALVFGGAVLTGGSVAVADAATGGAVSRFFNSLLGQSPSLQDQRPNIPIPPNQTSASVTPTTSAVAQSQPTQVAGDVNGGRDPKPMPSTTHQATVTDVPTQTKPIQTPSLGETRTPKVDNLAVIADGQIGLKRDGNNIEISGVTTEVFGSKGAAIPMVGPTTFLLKVDQQTCDFVAINFTERPSDDSNGQTYLYEARGISLTYVIKLDGRRAVELLFYNRNPNPEKTTLSNIAYGEKVQVKFPDPQGKSVVFSNPDSNNVETTIDLTRMYGSRGLFPDSTVKFGVHAANSSYRFSQQCSVNIIDPKVIR